MNLPNKLTVFRVILIVPFVLVMLGSYAGWEWYLALFGGIDAYADYIALGIFIVASLTDMLDGKIARKYNLVTNFGKFMDPLADKLLVCAALICLIEMDRIPAWIVIIISAVNLLSAASGLSQRTIRWLSQQATGENSSRRFRMIYGLPDDCQYRWRSHVLTQVVMVDCRHSDSRFP